MTQMMGFTLYFLKASPNYMTQKGGSLVKNNIRWPHFVFPKVSLMFTITKGGPTSQFL